MVERKNAVHDVESTVYYTHTHSANMHIRVYYNVPFNHSKMWEHIHFYMCISTSKGLNASARTNKKTWKEKKEHHLKAQQPLKCISHIRISHLKAYFLSLPLHSFVHFKRGNEIVFSAHFRIAKGKPKKPIESLFFSLTRRILYPHKVQIECGWIFSSQCTPCIPCWNSAHFHLFVFATFNVLTKYWPVPFGVWVCTTLKIEKS